MFAEERLARPCWLVCGAQARPGQPHDSLKYELGGQKACQSLQISNELNELPTQKMQLKGTITETS